MNRRNLHELLSDLDDLCKRAKDVGVSSNTEQALNYARNLLWLDSEATQGAVRSDSVPPVLSGNRLARSAADEAFRNARRLLKGIS